MKKSGRSAKVIPSLEVSGFKQRKFDRWLSRWSRRGVTFSWDKVEVEFIHRKYTNFRIEATLDQMKQMLGSVLNDFQDEPDCEDCTG